MGDPLTGRAAGEALGVLMRLGASGQRFDAPKVTGRLRSSWGRATLNRSLARRRRDWFQPTYAMFVEHGTGRPRARACRPSRAPDRPRLAVAA